MPPRAVLLLLLLLLLLLFLLPLPFASSGSSPLFLRRPGVGVPLPDEFEFLACRCCRPSVMAGRRPSLASTPRVVRPAPDDVDRCAVDLLQAAPPPPPPTPPPT